MTHLERLARAREFCETAMSTARSLRDERDAGRRAVELTEQIELEEMALLRGADVVTADWPATPPVVVPEGAYRHVENCGQPVRV